MRSARSQLGQRADLHLGGATINCATPHGGVGWTSVLLLTVGIWRLAAAEDFPQQLHVHGGKAIYEAACAACHGAKGEGTPKALAGFDKPTSFPYFNKCDETTPEFTRDYKASIRDGGAARGFSPIMPSFSGVDHHRRQLLAPRRGFRA